MGDVMGLNQGADNNYRKLLDLKGRIGKDEKYISASESPWLMTSNGVTFDLLDLFKGYDSFTNDGIERKKAKRPAEEEFELDPEPLAEDDVAEEVHEDVEPEPEMVAEDDAANQDDLVDEEGNVKAAKTPLQVKRWREPFGNPGTTVRVKYKGSKDNVFSGVISAASSLIPHLSQTRSTFTYSSDYNRLTNTGGADMARLDSQNFQRLLHTNMHDLLTGLSEQFPDITISIRKGDEVRVEPFKPGEHYECI
jgi:hypothetical protein